MTTNYIGVFFTPWWDEAETGPAPDCPICGAMMVREGRFAADPSQWREGWECLSCGHRIPDQP